VTVSGSFILTTVVYVADTLRNVVYTQTDRLPYAENMQYILAGALNVSGTVSGTSWLSARFNQPKGVIFNGGRTSSIGTMVADSENHTLRTGTYLDRTTSDFAHYAGKPGESGHVDGLLSSGLVRLNRPGYIIQGGSNRVFFTDEIHSTVRMLTVDGANSRVETIAGVPGARGLRDGSGANALFDEPTDLVWIASGAGAGTTGTLFVADTGNGVLRGITITANGGNTQATVGTVPLVNGTVSGTTSGTGSGTNSGIGGGNNSGGNNGGGNNVGNNNASDGGGGGAPSLWFAAALFVLPAIRHLLRRLP
jgi:hypothetical protein